MKSFLHHGVMILLLAVCLALQACGGAQSETAPRYDNMTAADLYPLAEGNVWSYNLLTDVDDAPTLSITRVVSENGRQFEVSSNDGAPILYEMREDGVYRPGSSSYLLKDPIAVGQSWRTSREREARIESVDLTMETNAGTFEQCIRVVETPGETAVDTRVLSTVYCPGVGPVEIDARMTSEMTGQVAYVTATLLGYTAN